MLSVLGTTALALGLPYFSTPDERITNVHRRRDELEYVHTPKPLTKRAKRRARGKTKGQP